MNESENLVADVEKIKARVVQWTERHKKAGIPSWDNRESYETSRQLRHQATDILKACGDGNAR